MKAMLGDMLAVVADVICPTHCSNHMDDHGYYIGKRCSCRWNEMKNRFYNCTVKTLNKFGTYDVKFDDGDSNSAVPLERMSILRVENQSKGTQLFPVGTIVWTNDEKDGDIHQGKVIHWHDKEVFIDFNHTAFTAIDVFHRIENKKRLQFYDCTVVKLNNDATYEVVFDDDSDLHVVIPSHIAGEWFEKDYRCEHCSSFTVESLQMAIATTELMYQNPELGKRLAMSQITCKVEVKLLKDLTLHAKEYGLPFVSEEVEEEEEVQLLTEKDPVLLTEKNAIYLLANGIEIQVAKAWLEDGGRGADSALAFQVLGTAEGLQGTVSLTIEPLSDAAYFELLCIWLQFGTKRLCNELAHKNIYSLLRLADYFCLDKLRETLIRWKTSNALLPVCRRFHRAFRKAATQKKKQRALARLRERERERDARHHSSRNIRCCRCRHIFQPPSNYNGRHPHCRACRR